MTCMAPSSTSVANLSPYGRIILVVVDDICLNSPAATITLTSNVGGRRVCPGEVVTYMCTATGVGILEWTAEPFILDSGGNRITYLSTDVQRIGQTVNCVDPSPAQDCADFQATLLSIGNVQMMSGATLADMTSNLTVTATARLNTTVVQRRGTTTTEILTATNAVNVTSMFPNVLENERPLS